MISASAMRRCDNFSRTTVSMLVAGDWLGDGCYGVGVAGCEINWSANSEAFCARLSAAR